MRNILIAALLRRRCRAAGARAIGRRGPRRQARKRDARGAAQGVSRRRGQLSRAAGAPSRACAAERRARVQRDRRSHAARRRRSKGQMATMTGQIEQAQYRLRQLRGAVRRLSRRPTRGSPSGAPPARRRRSAPPSSRRRRRAAPRGRRRPRRRHRTAAAAAKDPDRAARVAAVERPGTGAARRGRISLRLSAVGGEALSRGRGAAEEGRRRLSRAPSAPAMRRTCSAAPISTRASRASPRSPSTITTRRCPTASVRPTASIISARR